MTTFSFKIFAILFFFSSFPCDLDALDGLDVAVGVSVDQFKCLKKSGKQFVIVRVWRNKGPGGIVDENAAKTIENAWKGGMASVGGYIFPCSNCAQNDPKQQIRTLLNYLSENSIQLDKLWLDVEQPKYWSENATANVEFIKGMVEELQSAGQQIGFYTSKSQWEPIMNEADKFRQFPLWYAHYDGQKNFKDFVKFGGWTKPEMKQFSGDVKNSCGVNIDENWK